MLRKLLSASLLLAASCLYAQFKGYSYARDISPVHQNGYYSVPLNAELLARSKSSFSDFRIYEATEKDTLETAYIFKWQDDLVETFEAHGKIIDKSYLTDGVQFLTIEFPDVKRVNQLMFDITESNFDKQVKIEGSNDNRNWKTIEENLRLVGVYWWGAYFRSVAVSFNESSCKYFRITITNVNWSPYKSHRKNITVNGVSSTNNKCLSGSYRQVKNLIVKRKDYIYDPSIKNDTVAYGAFLEAPPNPKAVHRRTDFRNPFNPTCININLPGAIHVHHIRLVSKDTGDFYRKISYRVVNSENEPAWTPLFDVSADDIFSSVTKNVYSSNNAFGDYLKINILNYNNRPLKDIAVEVYTQDAKLLCKLESGKQYRLFYGRHNDYEPQYDLQFFKEKINAMNDVTLGKELKAGEAAIEKPEPLVKDKMWLWVLMLSLMGFIGFFAFKLMKKQQDV